MRGILLFTCMFAIAAGPPAKPLPAAVSAYIADVDAECRQGGGMPGQHGENMVQRGDFNADGNDDFVVNIGNYDCSGAEGLLQNGWMGHTIAVFADGRSKAWEGSGYRATVRGRQLFIDTAGIYCGQYPLQTRAISDAKHCSRPLAWDSKARKFAWGSLSKARSID